MIIANSISVGLSLFIIALISKEKIIRRGKDNGIAQTFQRWLLICIVFAYFITSVFTYNLQTGMAEKQVENTFATTVTDVIADVKSKSDEAMENIATKVKWVYENNKDVDLASLLQGEDDAGDKYEICEINIVDQYGIIQKSTDASIVGFNFYDEDLENQQPKEFLVLLGDEKSLVQEFTENSRGEERKYAGLQLEKEKGFLQVA